MWNPVEDKEIFERFTMDSISKRAVNKTSLQKELKLPQNAATPLLAVIGRLDRQKGIDIVIESMTRLAALDWQLVVLAYGDDKGLESDLLKLVKAYPKKVSFKEELNLPLSRRIYASADMLLMPSRYEPCGLAQMIAMHYGCVPIASATGGLKDTIRDAPENSESANGFLSAPSDAAAFTATIQKALSSFQDDSTWRRMQQNGMKTDFSWQKPANEYLALYNRLTK
jgi:starch synthase